MQHQRWPQQSVQRWTNGSRLRWSSVGCLTLAQCNFAHRPYVCPTCSTSDGPNNRSNVGPTDLDYIGPLLGVHHWPNVILLIGPALVQLAAPTMAQVGPTRALPIGSRLAQSCFLCWLSTLAQCNSLHRP